MKKTSYSVPRCEGFLSQWESVLCTSPGLGESEDIDYEDLVIPELT